MTCEEIRKKLNAWLDNELSAREAGQVLDHLNECDACRAEAESLRLIIHAMDSLPVARLPKNLSARTMEAFRGKIERQGLIQWWQTLNFSLRGALCGAALAGLIFGAVLGSGMTESKQYPQNQYVTLYEIQGYIP